tara:strand:- start:12712 stop:13074 length:363 start_codon:yes stop_codon:yes gene_type:complete
MAVHDYVCHGCGDHWEDYLSRPVDHECGEPDVRIDWSHGQAPGLSGAEFHKIVHDGVTYSDSASWNAYKGRLARNLKVDPKQLNVISDTPAQRKVLAEEKFHRHSLQRKKADQAVREFKT